MEKLFRNFKIFNSHLDFPTPDSPITRIFSLICWFIFCECLNYLLSNSYGIINENNTKLTIIWLVFVVLFFIMCHLSKILLAPLATKIVNLPTHRHPAPLATKNLNYQRHGQPAPPTASKPKLTSTKH